MFAPCAGSVRASAHTTNEIPRALAIRMRVSAQSPQNERGIVMPMVEDLQRVFTAILPGAAQGIGQRCTMTATTFGPVQL
jgi:hypothetical protein